ncbi:MAG: hypothetical protein DRG78_03760 [Epsilonproteobacteria bacterium]|nr:MAG: hypothetical protein DRG78_03760 [Campylobacterota bacterium]
MKLTKLKLTYKISGLIIPTSIPSSDDNNIVIAHLEFKQNDNSLGMLEFNEKAKDPRIVYKTDLGYAGFRLEPGSNLEQELFFEDDEVIDEVVINWLADPHSTKDYNIELIRRVNKITEIKNIQMNSKGDGILNINSITFSKV